MKKRAVVVCPGRGTYTKETLGYLKRHGASVSDFLEDIDRRRAAIGEPSITSLDASNSFKPELHTKGEHASALIYACAYADFMAIDRDRYEIVALAGNSMGWYLALALAQSLDSAGSFDLINGMGSMMKDEIIGGQVIYPLCDADWRPSPEREAMVWRTVAAIRAQGAAGAEVYTSIRLGGYLVLGANHAGVNDLLKSLPPIENYPFQLINHAAFHTPLLRKISDRALANFPEQMFHPPHVPLIDGRGAIWQPHSTDVRNLYHYTLGHQVVEPFDFSAAVTVGLKEFAPDCLILLGPGSSLGGSLGQILIANDWQGLNSKSAFSVRQATDPFVFAMGRDEQRTKVSKTLLR